MMYVYEELEHRHPLSHPARIVPFDALLSTGLGRDAKRPRSVVQGSMEPEPSGFGPSATAGLPRVTAALTDRPGLVALDPIVVCTVLSTVYAECWMLDAKMKGGKKRC